MQIKSTFVVLTNCLIALPRRYYGQKGISSPKQKENTQHDVKSTDMKIVSKADLSGQGLFM